MIREIESEFTYRLQVIAQRIALAKYVKLIFTSGGFPSMVEGERKGKDVPMEEWS